MSATYEGMSPGGHETYATSIFSKIKTYLDSNPYGYVSKTGDTMTGNLTAPKFIGALQGNASTASKLGSSNVGSATQPIYLNGGTATACTHTLGKSVPSNAVFTDTKNTAGSTDTSSKIFLIGATSQAANPQTYSQDTAYVGTDGCLYSGGSKVLTAHQDISGKADKSATVSTVTWSNNKLTKTINGTTSDVVSAATILGNLTSSQVTSALGYTPASVNTTYDFESSDNSISFMGRAVGSVETVDMTVNGKVSTEGDTISGDYVNTADFIEAGVTGKRVTTYGPWGIDIDEYVGTSLWSKLSLRDSDILLTKTWDGTHNSLKATIAYLAGYSDTSGTSNYSNYTRVRRVSKDSRYKPGTNTLVVEEFPSNSANIPTNDWYHIYTSEGSDADYAVQLALGMTASGVYYRKCITGGWGNWIDLMRPSWGNISGKPTVVYANGSNKNVTAGTVLNCCSFTLSAGTYLITYMAGFPSGQGNWKTCGAVVATANNSSKPVNQAGLCNYRYGYDNETRTHGSTMHTVSTNTTLYLNLWGRGSGALGGCFGEIRAIRLY